MRLVVVCLLLLFSPTLAYASGVHLVTDAFKLDPSWQPVQAAQPAQPTLPPAPFQLSAPCLACRAGTFVSAAAEPALPAAQQAKAPTASPAPSRAPVARAPVPTTKRVIAIGDSWRLAHGREFSIRLTPTQEECAPLVRLTF